jgi:hypothetical protein
MGMAVILGLIAALGLALFPGAADAKGKKKHKGGSNVTVMTRNLYLGSDLTDALNEAVKLGTPGHQDSYADAVGQVLQNVNATDFGRRAVSLAQEIDSNRPDLVGLQEGALWRLQVPSDATPLNPSSETATVVAFDFIQQLLDQLNAKARTKKECREKHIKPSSTKCFRGYRLVTSQNEFDFESFADFDHNPGPDGQTFDITASTSAADFAKWLLGNDDTGIEFGEPPTPSFPADANFDTSRTGQTPDPPAADGSPGTDCGTAPKYDSNPAPGPAFGDAGWPFDGYDRDTDPITPGVQTPVCVFHGIDMDIRLTMRDAILARVGAGVKTSNPSGGHYGTHLQYVAGGIPIPVDRGFNQVDANVRGHGFHFVNTHFEAFDSAATGNPTNFGPVDRGQVREAQAKQLLTGPLQSQLPVVLVGDLNSNNPPVQPGDELGYNVLVAGGMQERTSTPVSCCIENGLINTPSTAGMDHQVDHVMTNSAAIALLRGFQTHTFANGLWSSDHAGVGAVLHMPGGEHKKK